jgi:hypothetical protein
LAREFQHYIYILSRRRYLRIYRIIYIMAQI